MRAILSLSLLGVAAMLAGCAGRDANPEPVDWAFDHYYTCHDIRAEKDRIQQATQARGVEQAALKQRDDALMTRTIPFALPGLSALDQSRFSGAKDLSPQQAEIEALKARDAHLNSMAVDRGC